MRNTPEEIVDISYYKRLYNQRPILCMGSGISLDYFNSLVYDNFITIGVNATFLQYTPAFHFHQDSLNNEPRDAIQLAMRRNILAVKTPMVCLSPHNDVLGGIVLKCVYARSTKDSSEDSPFITFIDKSLGVDYHFSYDLNKHLVLHSFSGIALPQIAAWLSDGPIVLVGMFDSGALQADKRCLIYRTISRSGEHMKQSNKMRQILNDKNSIEFYPEDIRKRMYTISKDCSLEIPFVEPEYFYAKS